MVRHHNVLDCNPCMEERLMRNPARSSGATMVCLAFAIVTSVLGSEAVAQIPQNGPHPYQKIRPILVVTSRGEYHMAKVRDSVAFWNRELAALGVSMRLGSVSRIESQAGGANDVFKERRPHSITVVFPEGAYRSRIFRGEDGNFNPVIAVNRDNNLVITHSLGHALGLRHNATPGSLMHFAGPAKSNLLAAEDKARLRELYSHHVASR
jgi:hypothetical protein